jgi:hypothetical protein
MLVTHHWRAGDGARIGNLHQSIDLLPISRKPRPLHRFIKNPSNKIRSSCRN